MPWSVLNIKECFATSHLILMSSTKSELHPMYIYIYIYIYICISSGVCGQQKRNFNTNGCIKNLSTLGVYFYECCGGVY